MEITSVEVCATVDLILKDIDLVNEAPIMKKNSHSTYLWKMSQPNELSYDHQISGSYSEPQPEVFWPIIETAVVWSRHSCKTASTAKVLYYLMTPICKTAILNGVSFKA